MNNIEKFKEMGIRIRKERDEYRASSELWRLRERARTLKTRKAKEKAWDKFETAFKAKFPDGAVVWIDEGIQFDRFRADSFVTYKPMQVVIRHNTGHGIYFDGLEYDRVEVFYDPCGHDNLMALELAQLNKEAVAS